MANKESCCVCYDPKLDLLIYQSKSKLEKLSNEIVKFKCYGYSCDKKAEEKSDLLLNYLRVLSDENRNINLGGKPCLNCYNLQALAEKVRQLAHDCDIICRKDVLKVEDELIRNKWIMANPHCVSRERWEKLSYIVCDIFDIEISAEDVTENCDIDLEVLSIEEACDLSFELSRNIIPCDVMIAVSVFKEVCDLDLKVSRDEIECEIDFNLLIEQIECDLTLKIYQELIECNLSFDIIKTIYENDCSIEKNEKEELCLVTAINKYPIDKLKLQEKPDLKNLKNLGIDLSESKYCKNSEKFITNLKQDYSGKL